MTIGAGSVSHLLVLSLAICLGSVGVRGEAESTNRDNDTVRVAFVVAGDPAPRVAGMANMVQQRLLNRDNLAIVERNDLDQIIAEQRLGLLFGAEGGKARARLGQVSRAEVLAILRPKEQSSAELVIFETNRGLRLFHSDLALDGSIQEAAGAIHELFLEALNRHRQPVSALVAVAPWVNDNLTYEHVGAMRGFNRPLRQWLRQTPGIRTVEIEEAQAIADELLRSKGSRGVRRQLPILVEGTYTVVEREGGETYRLTITLRRGEETLKTVESNQLPREKIADFLRQKVLSEIRALTGEGIPDRDPDVDAQQLADRAAQYVKIGQYADALSLTEAALLVRPGDLAQHIRALRLYEPLARHAFGSPSDADELEKASQRTLRVWQRGRPHYKYVVRNGLLHASSRWADGQSTWWDLLADYVESAPRPILEARKKFPKHLIDGELAHLTERVFEQRRQLRDELFHLLEQRQPTGKQMEQLIYVTHLLIDGRSWTDYGERRKAYYKVQLRFLRAISGVPDPLQYIGHNILPEAEHSLDNVEKKYYQQVARLPSKPLRQRAKNILDEAGVREKDPATLFVRLRDALSQPDPPLRKLTLSAKDAGDSTYPVFPTGWLRCRDGLDLVWERHQRNALYLMKEPGKLEPVFRIDLNTPEGWKPHTGHTFVNKSYDGYGLHHPCFDGRYIWAPVVGPKPRLVVIDPETSKTTVLDADDGLPPMNRGGAAAPVRPGVVCVTGSFATETKPMRAWVAIVHFNAGDSPEVEVFHEATEQFRREAPKHVRWSGPNLSFRAGPMYRMHAPGKPNEPSIVAWREFDQNFMAHGPLWIDPIAKTVKATSRGPWGRSRQPAPFDNRLYFINHRSDNRTPLMSVGATKRDQNTETPDVPSIHKPITFKDEIVGVAEDGHAYRIAPGTSTVSPLDPQLPMTNKHTRLVRSAHFGLVMLVPVSPDNFLCEAYVITRLALGGANLSKLTTTKMKQPSTAARDKVDVGTPAYKVLVELGRPYEAGSLTQFPDGLTQAAWYYGGPHRDKQGHEAFDFGVILKSPGRADWFPRPD